MIFVDELRIGRRAGRRKWCHLASNMSLEELHEMAKAMELRRRYFHPHPYPHYDLTPAQRREVVGLGAKEVTSREMVVRLRRRWGGTG